MGVLNKDEITRRLNRGELVKGARRTPDGRFDVEPASYDLMTGKVVYKQPSVADKKGEVVTQSYDPHSSPDNQPTVTLQPGQMIFVITHEELQLPEDICGTVLSRNKLAKDGILALNAGHVDPGYTGPILIRLISLRATPWTLRLGEPIFTTIFQTMECKSGDQLLSHPGLRSERALELVRAMADNSLSNALFDLYALEMKRGLYEHYATVLADLRKELGQEFLRRDEFGKALWRWVRSNFLSILGFLVVMMTVIVRWHSIIELIRKRTP
jgi:deoxycytidine triphosphate deaminase